MKYNSKEISKPMVVTETQCQTCLSKNTEDLSSFQGMGRHIEV